MSVNLVILNTSYFYQLLISLPNDVSVDDDLDSTFTEKHEVNKAYFSLEESDESIGTYGDPESRF